MKVFLLGGAGILIVCFLSFQGSVLYNWFTSGKLERSEGSSVTEGIGQGRVTKNLEGSPVDGALLMKDTASVEMVRVIFQMHP